MSWVNDLASSLGIPAGTATLAVAIYAACTAAERAARPEALKGIGHVLQNSSWEASFQPSAVVEKVFKWTFGERQFSTTCVWRSLAASLIFTVTFVAIYHGIFGWNFSSLAFLSAMSPEDRVYFRPFSVIFEELATTISGLVLLGALPDYLALAKTRILVIAIGNARRMRGVILVVILDIVLSAAISFLWVMGAGMMIPWYAYAGGWGGDTLISVWFTSIIDVQWLAGMFTGQAAPDDNLLGTAQQILRMMASPFTHALNLSLIPVLLMSTLVTSTWTILILLSTTVIKLLPSLQRFTAWFFDVEKHPVQAIGIVAGALVMIVSLIWTMLRALI